MDLKELFKNKFKLLNEDNKNMTHAELYKHHKDLEESKWKEVGEIESKKDEINKQYIQAVKDGDKGAAEKLKQQFYDLDNKAVNAASEAREHHSNATSVHLSAQQSGNYNPKDFDYNPNSIKQPEPAKPESPKTNNAEPTPDAATKTTNSTNEPSALDQAKPQTKAPTEFKKAEPATEKQPEQTNTEIKTPKDNEPSVLKGAKEYDGKNPVEAPKPEAKSVEAKPQEVSNMPKDNSHLTGGTKQLDQSNPLNRNPLNDHGGTGITTNQPPIIPSSGQQVHDVTQHASNPVDRWANFKQSSHDAYGHLKNFAGQHYQNIKQNLGQHYQNIKQNLGQHYQNIKQNAHEHLSNAKQFATDHAHEIAGAGALGAAGLAAYAAYKHFKNKKKQPAPQPHH